MTAVQAPIRPAADPGRTERRRQKAWRFVLLGPSLALLALLAAVVAIFAYRSVSAQAGGQLGLSGALHSGALNGFFWSAMARTLLLAVIATLLACVASLLVADALVAVKRTAVTAATSVVLFSPLVVSMTVRGYGWLLVLDQRWISGLLNVVGNHTRFMQLSPEMIATIVVMSHALMPLIALPILARRREIEDLHITRAARDLGAGHWRVLLSVIAPLATPTVLRVGALAFGLAMGAFGIPAIIGRGRVQVVSELLYQNLLITDWSSAFVQLIALLLITGLVVVCVFRLATAVGGRSAVHGGGAG